MLKPTCGFVYVFQGVSVTDKGACVELFAVLGAGVVDGDGDSILTASELQDVKMIAKMMKMDCFLIKTPLEVFWRQPPNGLRPAPGEAKRPHAFCWVPVALGP